MIDYSTTLCAAATLGIFAALRATLTREERAPLRLRRLPRQRRPR